jgi:hypothetical protein
MRFSGDRSKDKMKQPSELRPMASDHTAAASSSAASAFPPAGDSPILLSSDSPYIDLLHLNFASLLITLFTAGYLYIPTSIVDE